MKKFAILLSFSICADGALFKSLSARSLAAAGLPDPQCKTGVISLKVTGKPQSCCAGYCGECTDYPTCEKVRGQNSKNACCASAVHEMRCGNAPANVCLKKCSETVPPCIMDETVFDIEPPKRSASADCGNAVSDWRTHADSAMKPPPSTLKVTAPTTTTTTTTTIAQSDWDLSGSQDFVLKATIKTNAAAGTIVGKPFADGLWKSGGGAGQGKMIFLRHGRFGMDIGWVGYFNCGQTVNDGKSHDVALKFVKADGDQYQLFIDDMSTPCKKGLRPVKDHPDTSIVIGKAIGHRVTGGVANGDMAPDFDGEITSVSYELLK